MNNEEKILATLGQMQERMDVNFERIDFRFERIESDINGMKSDINDMKSDIEDLKESNEKIRCFQIDVESNYWQRIAGALDGVIGGINRNQEQDDRLTVLEKKVDNHSSRISFLECNCEAI